MGERARQSDRNADRFHIITVMDYLAQNTSIEDITVSAICEKAQISRTSFYRLFEDKYDAANWFMCQALDMGNRLIGIHYTWIDGNVVTLSGCMLMQNLMVSAWKSPGYHAMKETGIRRRTHDVLEVLGMRGIEVDDELRFQVDCYAYLESYIVRTWIGEKDQRSIEEQAAYIEHCVPPMLHDLLKDPVDPKPGKRLTLSSMLMGLS